MPQSIDRPERGAGRRRDAPAVPRSVPARGEDRSLPYLQRTAGNRAVSRMLATGVVQRQVLTKTIEGRVYYYSSYEKELVERGHHGSTRVYTTREEAEAADLEWKAMSRPLPPVPPPRVDLAALVMDLHQLDLDALHAQWIPRLRPPFEEWLRVAAGDNAVDYAKWLIKKGELKADPPADYDGSERLLTPELLDATDQTVRQDVGRFLQGNAGNSIPEILKSYQDYQKGTQDFWYNVFQWSATKSPGGPADRTAVEFDSWPYSRDTHRPSEVTSRVYLNTTEAHTATVAKDLATILDLDECVAIKYAPGKAAAFRRDAIVIYVKGPVDGIVSRIGEYQKQHQNRFVDETVRLTAPTGLTGVGTAEHPTGKDSYSDLTSQAVRKALAQTNNVSQLPALLRRELLNAGLDPDHPGRLRK